MIAGRVFYIVDSGDVENYIQESAEGEVLGLERTRHGRDKKNGGIESNNQVVNYGIEIKI